MEADGRNVGRTPRSDDSGVQTVDLTPIRDAPSESQQKFLRFYVIFISVARNMWPPRNFVQLFFLKNTKPASLE